MVDRRAGDELDLLDSSIRTAGGASLSTTLYVLSGIVYAFVTSPSATGTYFFLAVSVSLVLRPIRGISQTLQKIGSERGERVEAYFGVAVAFAAGYVLLVGAVTVAASESLARLTIFETRLLVPVGVFALSRVLLSISGSLLGAIGYPSAKTWLSSAQSGLQLLVLLAFAPLFSSAADLLLVVAGVRFLLVGPVVLLLGVAPAVPDWHALSRAWAFAKWSVPDQVLDRFSYNMPVYVLGVVATPAAVGIYEAADRFADFGATIAWQLSSPLLTKVSGDASVGADTSAYLDSAITGGTGVTFVVFAYLLSASDVVAAIAFAGSQRVFALTVLTVGGVNILRGFWTLASHAMEGLGKPSVSFRTKLYGLVVSVPIPAVLGSEFGALAGAAGYGVMNLVVFGYVLYYARGVFGEIPLDAPLAAKFTLGLVVATFTTTGLVTGLSRVGLSPVVVAIAAALGCALVFVGLLVAISRETRVAFDRAATIYLGWARSS